MTSPLPRGCSTTELAGPTQKLSVVTFRHHNLASVSTSGAGDRIRTRDVQLGRLTLYQLSYSRDVLVLSFQISMRLVEGDGFEPSKA